MGIFLSRFNRLKTKIEILEYLDEKIKEVERYRYSAEQRHKKIVGTLILYSVILYITTAFIFYFYFFPASLYDQIFYIIPLLIFPILILLTKKMITWYYKCKISKNQDSMQSEKNTKEILSKFATDQLEACPLTAEIPEQSSTSNPPSKEKQALNAKSRIYPIVTNIPTSKSYYGPILPRARKSEYKFSRYKVDFDDFKYRDVYDDDDDFIEDRCAIFCPICKTFNGTALKEEYTYIRYRCRNCDSLNSPRERMTYNVEPDEYISYLREHHASLSLSLSSKKTEPVKNDVEAVD